MSNFVFQYGNRYMCGDPSHEGCTNESRIRSTCPAPKAIVPLVGTQRVNVIHATLANVRAGAQPVSEDVLAHPNFAGILPPLPHRAREHDYRSAPFDVLPFRASLPGPSAVQRRQVESHDAIGILTRERQSVGELRNERAGAAERYPGRASGSNPIRPSRSVDAPGVLSRVEPRDCPVTPEAASNQHTAGRHSERSGHREVNRPCEVPGYRDGQADDRRWGMRTASARPLIESRRDEPISHERPRRQARRSQEAQTIQTRSIEHDGGILLPQSTIEGVQRVPAVKAAEIQASAKPGSSKSVSHRDVADAEGKPAKGHEHHGTTQKPRNGGLVAYAPVLCLRPTAVAGAIPEADNVDAGATPQVPPTPKVEGSGKKPVEASKQYTDVVRPGHGRYELLYPSIDIPAKASQAAKESEEVPVLPAHQDAALSLADTTGDCTTQDDASKSDFEETGILTPSASSGSEVSIDFEEAEKIAASEPESSSTVPGSNSRSFSDQQNISEFGVDDDTALTSSTTAQAGADSVAMAQGARATSPTLEASALPADSSSSEVETSPAGPIIATASMRVAPEPEGKIAIPNPHTEEDWIIIDRQPGPPAALSPLARRLKAKKEIGDALTAKKQSKNTGQNLGADLFDCEEACGLEGEDWTLV